MRHEIVTGHGTFSRSRNDRFLRKGTEKITSKYSNYQRSNEGEAGGVTGERRRPNEGIKRQKREFKRRQGQHNTTVQEIERALKKRYLRPTIGHQGKKGARTETSKRRKKTRQD